MDFIYKESLEGYNWVLGTRVGDCFSKHVLRVQSDKAKKLLEESTKLGYPGALWGNCYGSYLADEEVNRTCQLYTIHKMLQDGIDNALRVIIGENGSLWADNMHTAVRNILVKGEGVTLGDINMYIVDMRDTGLPVVVNYKKALRDSLYDIKGVVACGQNRLRKTTGEVGKVGYTVMEFMRENEIEREDFEESILRIGVYK